MKKKLYATSLAILVAGSCLADDAPSLHIRKMDGESTVALFELLSIKYADSDMVINMKDGTKLVCPLDDIIVVSLGQQTTAIGNLFPDSATAETAVITDLKGRVVSKGKGRQVSLPATKGVYIITTGHQSKKIIVN